MHLQKAPHRRSLLIICVICTAAILALEGFGPFNELELKLEDWLMRYGRAAPDSGKLIFLAIDADSQTLDKVEAKELAASPALGLMKRSFPWPRNLYPLILDRLIGAGAKAVVIDMRLPTPREGDDEFRAALERYRNQVVIGANFPENEERGASESAIEWPSETLIPDPRPEDPRIGYVTLWTDPDEKVRRVWYRRRFLETQGMAPTEGEAVFESLAARGVRQAGFGDLIPMDTRPHRIRFSYWGKTASLQFFPHSLYEIFVPTYWEHNYRNGELFKDKIVVLGPSGNWSKDFVETPFGRIDGPLLHLNAMNALLTKEFLVDAPPWLRNVLLVFAGAISWAFGYSVRSPKLRLILLLLAIAGWAGAAILAYSVGFVTPVLSPLAVLVFSGAGFLFIEYLLEQRERQRIRSTLERYVSKDVVKEVLDNPESYLHTAGGARMKITVLFSDIRGFTSMVESGDEVKLVAQLNEYFTEMVRIVYEHVGTLDKFIGDAVMAHWGSVVSHGDSRDACHAVSTALQMLRELERLNGVWKERGFPELRIGLGVNHGQAICAHMGSEEKHEFSAIGDAVNLASRLEGATKTFHQDLLLGESVAPLVRERFLLRTVDLLRVVGKTKPVEVFTALGERKDGLEPAWLPRYEEGVRQYRTRAFAEAIASFAAVAAEMPEDWLAQEYMRRCHAYAAAPPDPDWDGSFVMGSK